MNFLGARFDVDTSRRPPTADPEFDPSPSVPVRLRDFDSLEERKRLVVNPFLAVLGLIGLIWLARGLMFSPIPVLTGLVVLPMLILPYLIQYHCLDCGRTGPYPRHRDHACSGVLGRFREGHRPGLRFPTPWAQLVVWGWVLGAAAVLLAVLSIE